MGRIFRCVLAASAMLRPLGAEVIATSLTSDNIYQNHDLLSRDSLKASNFAHTSLLSLFDQAPSSGFASTFSSAESKSRKSALAHDKRAPV